MEQSEIYRSWFSALTSESILVANDNERSEALFPTQCPCHICYKSELKTWCNDK